MATGDGAAKPSRGSKEAAAEAEQQQAPPSRSTQLEGAAGRKARRIAGSGQDITALLPKGKAVSMCYHSGKLLIKHVCQQCTPVHSYTIGFPGSALDLALPDDKNLL